MKLETECSRRITEVNEQQLRQTFEADARRGEFIILSQESEVYIQAAGKDDGPYVLEYRDGDDDHHFSAAGVLCKEDVLRAFLWYLYGDNRWRSEFSWEKLTI